jgi:hypothetical protein
VKHFSFKEELSEILSKTYAGLHAKYPLSSQIAIKLQTSGQILRKY